MYALLLLGLIAMMVTACSKESGNEEPDLPIEDPANIDPFSPVTVLMYNYPLNNEPVFFTFPSLDPHNPTTADVIDGMFHYLPVGCPFTVTQMVPASMQIYQSLYSAHDADYPVILVSAWGGKMKVRCLPSKNSENIKTQLLALRVPKEDGGFRSMTPDETEYFEYAYEEKGDWQTLYFPENHTGDFRVVNMSIKGEYDFNGTHQELHSRTWFFVQLPWTDDRKVFDRVPLFTMEDLRK